MRVLMIVNDPDLIAARPYLSLKPGDEILQIGPSQENLEQIRQLRPDLVLVDPEMQEISAHDLAAELHDDLSLRDIPVMLVPGMETHRSQAESLGQAGGDAGSTTRRSDTSHTLSEHWITDCSSLERQILDSLDHAVVVTGLDGTIVYWNRFAEELYGTPAEKALAHTSEEVLGRRSRFYQDQVIPHLKSGKRWTMEYYVRGQDGRMRPVLLSITPLFSPDQELIGITEIATDISERKENDSRYQRALFNAPFPVVIHAEDGEVIMINRAWTELSGFEPGHMPRMEDWVEKAYPANQRDEVLERIRQQFHSGERVVDGGEAEIHTLRRRKRTWRFSSAPLGRTLDGRRTMISMAVDLTDRKEAEDQLQRAISDAPFPIMIHTEDGEVVLINRLWQELSGYEQEEISTLADWVHKAYGERLPAVLEQIGTRYDMSRRVYLDDEYLIDTKDGSQRIWNFSSAPLGYTPDGRRLVMASAVDVTERREVEKRFELAVLDSPYPIVLYAEDGEMLLVNRAWTELSGYDLGDIPTIQVWTEKAYQEKAPLVQATIEQVRSIEGRMYVGEFQVHTKDGQVRVWDFSTTSLGSLADGRRIRMSIANDITDRREVEQRFELAVQNAPFPLAIYAEDGEFILLNQTFQEFTGYTSEDLPDVKTWFDKALRSRYPLIEEWVHKLYSETGRVHKGEFAVTTNDGRERVWDIDGVWLGRLPDGRRLRMFMAVDLTDRKEMEQRFAQAVRYAPFPLSIYTDDGEMLLVNQSFTELTGYTLLDLPNRADYLAKTRPAEQSAATIFGRSQPERSAASEIVQMQNGDTLPVVTDLPSDQPDWTGEILVETRDGRQRMWDTVSVPIGHLPDGRRLHMSMSADITERQQIEQHFRRAVEEAPFPIALLTDDGQMLLVNQAWTAYSGYTLADIPTLSLWIDRAYEDRKEAIAQRIRQSQEVGERYHFGEMTIRTRYGGERLWDFNGVWLGELPNGRRLRMVIAVDLTERRQVEQRFTMAVEHAPYPIAIVAEDGEMLSINQAFTHYSGYTLEDVPTSDAWLENAYKQHKAEIEDQLLQDLKLGRPSRGEYVITTKDGRQRVWESQGVPLGQLPDGRKLRMAVSVDITDRRQVEQRFERAVDNAPFPAIIHAEDGQVLMVNQAFQRISGYTPEDLPTLEAYAELAYRDNKDVALAAALRGYETSGLVKGGEFVLYTKAGRKRIWDFMSVDIGLLPDGRRTRLAMASDVTERKHFEEALRESESKYRSLVESSNLAILVYQQRRVVFVNSAFAGLLELIAPDVEGRSLEDMQVFVDPADQQLFMDNILKVEQGALPMAFFEARMRTAAGRLVWAEISLHPIEYQGRPAIQALLVDISDRRKAEDALSESESRYRQVVEHSTMLIATLSGERVIYINAAGAHLLGFDSAEDVVGCRLEELIHPDSYARLRQLAQDLNIKELSAHSSELSSETATFVEEEIIRKNGTRVVLGASLNFLPADNQPTLHIIAHDFTLRRRAREALRRQAALAQIDLAISRPEELASSLDRVVDIVCETLEIRVGVVVVLVDPKTGMIQPGGSSLGEQDAAVLDRLLVPQDSLSAFIVEEKKPWIVQDVKDDLFDPEYFTGTAVQAYAAIPIMVEQQVRGVLYILEDKPYLIEHDSLEFVDALSRRLSMAIAKVDLYEGIRSARDAAEQASRAKADFLANMSHELRTPLTTITTLAELLLDSQLDPVQSNYTQTILAGAGRLLELISHVLDFSRLEAHKQALAHQPFDLRRCIESSLDLVSVNAAAKGLQLEYFAPPDLPARFVGDSLQLGQVLTNLLSNAIKFTETGFVFLKVSQVPTVETTAGMAELLFTIQDSGIGISADRIPFLFQPFSQVDTSPARKYSGSGLGLVISKHIVELMDGRIWVASDGHSGSTFSFTVKLPLVDEEPDIFRLPDQPAMAGRSVVIMTQSGLARNVLQEWTAYWGCRTQIFFQPAQVLKWLEAGNHPHLLLVDYGYLVDGTFQRQLCSYLPNCPEDGSAPGSTVGQPPAGTVPTSETVKLVALVPFGEKRSLPAMLSHLPINPVKPGKLYSLLVSVFSPALDTTPETFEYPPPEIPDQSSLRVLLAEDDPLNRQALILRLQRLGYQVEPAANGLEVIQAIASGRYDIIFMDYQMPEMDGLFAIEYIRSSYPAERQPYIIGLTADARQEARNALLEAGANLYLTKPVKGEELYQALRQAAEFFHPNRWASRLSNWVAWSTTYQATDPIDESVFQDLAQAVGEDDRQNLVSLLDLFFENSQKLIDSIQADLSEMNWQQLRYDVHTLKGSAELLGAIQFGKFCKRVEQALIEGQIDGIAQQIELLQFEYARVRKAIEARYQTIQPGVEPSAVSSAEPLVPGPPPVNSVDEPQPEGEH